MVGNFTVYLREYDLDANTVSDTALEVLTVTGSYGASGSYTRKAVSATVNITVDKNLQYSIYLENNTTTGIGFAYMSGFNGTDHDPLTAEMTLETKIEESSTNSHFIHESLRHNLAVLTGDEDVLYSEFFGRTQDGYASDGIGSEFVEFNGAKARGLTTRAQFGTFKMAIC